MPRSLLRPTRPASPWPLPECAISAIDPYDERDALIAWTAHEGLIAEDLSVLLGGFCGRALARGVPLWRAIMTIPARHPKYGITGALWEVASGASPQYFGHDRMTSEPFLSSPTHYMIVNGVTSFRRALGPGTDDPGFPGLRDLAAQGATDYFARIASFDRDNRPLHEVEGLGGVVISFATRHPGGFTRDDIAMLDHGLPVLLLAAYRVAMSDLATGLLQAYLGRDAVHRVLMGQTRRGAVERVPAAILLTDLRSFTALADHLEGEAVVALLDDYFEAMVPPIHDGGGHILKFLGDGLLAMFPLEPEGARNVCRSALKAAKQCLQRNAAFNAGREAAFDPILRLDAVLHLGTVMYGNVGSADRIDFTAIGPAVNEASRIEALCEPLGHNLLISNTFATASGLNLKPLGAHSLRGVAEPRELYTLP